MPGLTELEAELASHRTNLKDLEEILAIMPENEEALTMKADVLVQIRDVQNKIAPLKPDTAASEQNTVDAGSASPSDKSKAEDSSAATKSGSAPNAPQQLFKVNENVQARYAADRQFYPATIVAVMGSSSAPIYTVKYKGYSETATVRWHEVKPVPAPASAAQKRKADGSPAVPSPAPASPAPTPINNGSVLSAPAIIDSALAASIKKEPSKVSDGPPRPEKAPKKVKTNKALEKAKSSWQDWQKKSGGSSKVAKVANKESMFRTGEDHTARVGFTGSGKTMSKDGVRAKHKFDTHDARY